MKPLLKVMMVLALVFASTFALLTLTGIVTVEKIQLWLEAARAINPWLLMLLVAGLLLADLVISVPTLSVMILAGYLLGAVLGTIAGTVGLLLAGVLGYLISARYGNHLFFALVKEPEQRTSAIETFARHGPVVILLSRAMPMLPEVSACLAGLTGMKFWRFLVLWLASILPYAAITNYAGSVSSLENPMPAVYTALGLCGFFWSCWFFFHRSHKRASLNTKMSEQ
ncbi:VTT domain-containing protein [Gilvimarinus sp. SDUM040013]|uniref:TVP38/TMEM64 family membrane protein n=1 Tax=Gilvimarinus gilvus TaxID=3058038 RepID=A0ABU4S154_9GAMM|nr:VTT domain-containing protein [Gilvimarinus sp. SDUM040013]MDO3384791.1 VTT domain-containing protein [Gilvimarinus sp. SDUM040013]MDX6850876.1 VTT domain-containing protein [Gilvimarinus sp. SDUM040013]